MNRNKLLALGLTGLTLIVGSVGLGKCCYSAYQGKIFDSTPTRERLLTLGYELERLERMHTIEVLNNPSLSKRYNKLLTESKELKANTEWAYFEKKLRESGNFFAGTLISTWLLGAYARYYYRRASEGFYHLTPMVSLIKKKNPKRR